MHITSKVIALSDIKIQHWMLYILLACILVLAGMPAHAGMPEGESAYERKDYRTANNEFLPLATAGNSEAQYYLGKIYLFGEGVPEDEIKSLDWYTKSAQHGHIVSQSMLGTIFLNGGKLIPKDYKQADYWLRKAAEQGDADAQYNLGVMYHDALGIQQDFIKATFWYRKAADHGFEMAKIDTGVSKALLNLGVMYRKGEGIQQDLVKADMLYFLAESAGDAIASNNRKDLELKMTIEQIDEAHALAKKWQREVGRLE